MVKHAFVRGFGQKKNIITSHFTLYFYFCLSDSVAILFGNVMIVHVEKSALISVLMISLQNSKLVLQNLHCIPVICHPQRY